MMTNKKLIGQKCDCFFTGAAMLCKTHAAAYKLLDAAKMAQEALDSAAQWIALGEEGEAAGSSWFRANPWFDKKRKALSAAIAAAEPRKVSQ